MTDPNELQSMADELVDELIAQMRGQLAAGEPLSLHEQQCVVEQLVKERNRAQAQRKPDNG